MPRWAPFVLRRCCSSLRTTRNSSGRRTATQTSRPVAAPSRRKIKDEKSDHLRSRWHALGIVIADMIFVDDALVPGGNDYPAAQAGAESIRVRDPHEMKGVSEAICMPRDRE